jgi:hypothetical protein
VIGAIALIAALVFVKSWRVKLGIFALWFGAILDDPQRPELRLPDRVRLHAALGDPHGAAFTAHWHRHGDRLLGLAIHGAPDR